MYAILEAVSLDTTGPTKPKDVVGKQFVQVLVDACSGWTDVQSMAKNSAAGTIIMQSLAKIQRLCDTKAKRLHTDVSKEYNTKALRDFLYMNETSATHTEPNASASNAFAERNFVN